MIKVIRAKMPEFYKTSVFKDANSRLFSDNKRGAQERRKFNKNIIESVRLKLFEMFKYKCAYCESPLFDTKAGVIDNFRPKEGARDLNRKVDKNHYFWLAYEWTNLYTSCSNCNKNKSDLFPIAEGSRRAPILATGQTLYSEENLLVDPCRDQPAKHIAFRSDGTAIGITARGFATIEVLNLNREALVFARREAAAEVLDKMISPLPLHKKELKLFLDGYFSKRAHRDYEGAIRNIVTAWFDEQRKLLPTESVSIRKISFVDSRPFEHRVPAIEILERMQALNHFSIKRISIKNYKTIGSLDLEMPQNSDSDEESWLLLLGDNGVGKSSVLQAIALALSDKKLIKRLGILPQHVLKTGETFGSVRIDSFESDYPMILEFNEKSFYKGKYEPKAFLLGYGSSRHLPKGSLHSGKYRGAFINIGNLFDYTAVLIDVDKWLSTVTPFDFNERVAPALFDLLEMKKGDAVAFNNGKLILTIHGRENELRDSSDGYKTMIGLACDIMQTLAVDQANYHTMHGIVLIDELGNHLHPRWRMRVVSALRRTFPKLQFIVSTHEPLCLRGLHHGEVNVMVRDKNHQIRVLDRKLLPDHNLLRVDQLLTSDLFGLINTLDPETERMFEDYYELLAKPENSLNDQEITRVNKLNTELANKEMVGPTPQMQALYKIVNETFAKKMAQDGYKTKTELRSETIDEIKQLLDNEDLDWLK